MSDKFHAVCPKCRHALRVRRDQVDRRVSCNFCGGVFTIRAPRRSAGSTPGAADGAAGAALEREKSQRAAEPDSIGVAEKPVLGLPHPFVLLSIGILVACTLTHILPAGQFQRRAARIDGVTRKLVVPGTYERMRRQPVGVFGGLVAVPTGFSQSADIIALVFLVGGAFCVLDQTGVLKAGMSTLLARVSRRRALLIPFACLIFGFGGVLFQLEEELIAFTPLLVRVAGRLGCRPVIALAMSVGVSIVGAAFSPIDPFLVGIAQQAAELPAFSGFYFRTVFLLLALAAWTALVARDAKRSPLADPVEAADHAAGSTLTARGCLILALVPGTFAVFLIGRVRFGWGYPEMSAAFLAMGVVVGILGGLGVDGTAQAYVKGFAAMAYAAILIGFARGISVVLEQGHIIDTIVTILFEPLRHLPVALTAVGMMLMQAVVHVPVPSTSGQAILTIPLLVPLADLLGFSRQITVLAFQYGAGLCEMISPTNGSLLAVLAAARVKYEDWIRFALPLVAVLALLGMFALITSIVIRF